MGGPLHHHHPPAPHPPNKQREQQRLKIYHLEGVPSTQTQRPEYRYLSTGSSGLWIRIQFLRIRIQMFFSMRIRIQMWIRILGQPYKICEQLPIKVLKKTKQIAGPYLLHFLK